MSALAEQSSDALFRQAPPFLDPFHCPPASSERARRANEQRARDGALILFAAQAASAPPPIK
jgi:hypothetical protein